MRELIQKLDRKLFFPFMSDEEASRYFVDNQVGHHAFVKGSLDNSPPALREFFELCTRNWPLHRFHFYYPKPCVIEPTLGYAVTQRHQLIPQSLWNTYVHHHKPAYSKFLLKPRHTLRLPTAVPMHYGWGNYWHFFNDILGVIGLADAAGLPADTPLLIAEGLPNRRFFQDILALSPSLQQRNWVLQSTNTKAYLQEAHFFNTAINSRENFDAVLRFIDFDASLQTEPAGNRRIFVGRRPQHGRNIVNLTEVRQLLARYEFDYIECDELSVRQQLDLFQHAAYVAGIHGAGLTNIIFRRGRPMKLLEIFSADFWNPCYYSLCTQYGYDYYSVVGSATSQPGTSIGNFTLDIAELEQRLLAMLAA